LCFDCDDLAGLVGAFLGAATGSLGAGQLSGA
jgi:hypothetical protein